jgi:hypothetical protein
MKNKIVLLMSIFLLVIIVSCERKDCHKTIKFVNYSDSIIYIGFTFGIDTLFASRFPNPISHDMYKVISMSENTSALTILSCLEGRISSSYIRIYIFTEHVLSSNTWGSIQKNYMVLQRYDLTKADLQRLNWKITYPPSEAMKDVKMYPSYSPPY